MYISQRRNSNVTYQVLKAVSNIDSGFLFSYLWWDTWLLLWFNILEDSKSATCCFNEVPTSPDHILQSIHGTQAFDTQRILIFQISTLYHVKLSWLDECRRSSSCIAISFLLVKAWWPQAWSRPLSRLRTAEKMRLDRTLTGRFEGLGRYHIL